jgi:hypothetical protein
MAAYLIPTCLVFALSSVVVGQNVCRQFRPVADRCDLTAGVKEQARCLLRPVKKFGNLGAPLPSLPPVLDRLIGQPIVQSISVEKVRSYLARNGIRETDVGGALSVRLSRPRYFVIHDTSDFLSGNDFPASVNDASWSANNLMVRVRRRICHVYLNRLGQSATAIRFESANSPVGTKFSSCHSAQRRAFLHIENIQPRIRDRSVSFSNDAIAPNPGFTGPQLQRLALLYVVASVRSGKWLIPAYHSPIDLGYPNRHDDPQNFNLNEWTEKLSALLDEINLP